MKEVKITIRINEELKLILKSIAISNKFTLQEQVIELIEMGLLVVRENKLKQNSK